MNMSLTFLVPLMLTAATASAQGIQPLTPETLREALERTVSPAAATALNDPVVRKQVAMDSPTHVMKRTERADFVAATRNPPFQFTVVSPYSAALVAAAEARRKFEETPKIDVGTANDALVAIAVQPGKNITTADAIESVAIKRAGQTIRAVRQSVRPVTVRTVAGLTRDLSEGRFVFDFATFAPTEEIEIVLVGKTRNFSWTISTEELAAMR
jgi:hypothetical protein